MAKRTYKHRVEGSLEEATVALVDDCGGPKKASHLPGCYVSASMLGKYMDGDDLENRNKTMPAKLVAYFESVCGAPHVSAWITAQYDHVVVPLPRPGPMNMTKFTADMGKEASEVFAAVGCALEDGCITPREAQDMISEIMDVMRVGMAAVQTLQTIGGSGS